MCCSIKRLSKGIYSVSTRRRLGFHLSDRAKTVDGELIAMDGYAYLTDETKPGELMVHLEGVPVDAPYWVVALGDQKGVRESFCPMI